ncbi:MAG TPA: NGG1p interacting factor NIF3 [Dissulfurispiraceae bacterium]|nr:NGG1p interacting factor NIF3 [Dissulfurispiraceae bacterium]
MNIADFFARAIAVGMENDPRGIDAVRAELGRVRKEYDDLKPKEKELFDSDRLENPYADSRMLAGDGSLPLRTMLVGVDIDLGELLLADRFRDRGVPVDLVFSHHPSGRALANLSAVMAMQADIISCAGVPINVAEGVLEGRISEIARRVLPINHTRVADAARLLNMPLCCLHTPADNMVASYLQKLFEEKKPYALDDVVELMMEIPEYADAAKINAGPRIFLGSKKRRTGKVFVDMTGGTEGAKEVFESLSLSGINTIVGMHLSEEHRKEAEKHHVNVVIAGHIASDNIGINLLLDKVMQDEQITVLECSGFRRFPRG